MKRKIFFYNNTSKIKMLKLYTETLDINLDIKIEPNFDSEINLETENILFLKLEDKNHVYKLNLFTNSISFDIDNVKFFTIPRF